MRGDDTDGTDDEEDGKDDELEARGSPDDLRLGTAKGQVIPMTASISFRQLPDSRSGCDPITPPPPPPTVPGPSPPHRTIFTLFLLIPRCARAHITSQGTLGAQPGEHEGHPEGIRAVRAASPPDIQETHADRRRTPHLLTTKVGMSKSALHSRIY